MTKAIAFSRQNEASLREHYLESALYSPLLTMLELRKYHFRSFFIDVPVLVLQSKGLFYSGVANNSRSLGIFSSSARKKGYL